MGRLKIIGILVAAFRRAKVLHGAMESNTTREQWYVAFPVAFLVALAGYYLPEFSESGTAIAVVSGIVALLGPLVSRYAAYRDKKESGTDLLVEAPEVNPFFYRVKKKETDHWKDFLGTRYDAVIAGWDLGVDEDDKVWDIKSCEIVGRYQRRTGTIEQSNARVADFRDKLKGTR